MSGSQEQQQLGFSREPSYIMLIRDCDRVRVARASVSDVMNILSYGVCVYVCVCVGCNAVAS